MLIRNTSKAISMRKFRNTIPLDASTVNVPKEEHEGKKIQYAIMYQKKECSSQLSEIFFYFLYVCVCRCELKKR